MIRLLMIGMFAVTVLVACTPVDTCYVTKTFTHKEPIDNYSIIGYGNFSHFEGTMNVSGYTLKITYSANAPIEYIDVLMNKHHEVLERGVDYECGAIV